MQKRRRWQKLVARLRERWPRLSDVSVRYRSAFAYVSGGLPDGDVVPLCRLHYAGSATNFGFAIALTRGGRDIYEDSVFPNGSFGGTPQDALDCACGLDLGDPSAWLMGGHELPPRH